RGVCDFVVESIPGHSEDGVDLDIGSAFCQEEAGIRDSSVTGVQTCALPIWEARSRRVPSRGASRSCGPACTWAHRYRSEERRVGEECRCRWSPYDSKKT